jgi:general secretion pathway protein G
MIRTNKHGFTLVEILIVVVILGILAAIVIPQFSNASQEASVNRVRADLQTMRSQIELYKIQHLGTPPALATFANQMTLQTNVSGVTGAADSNLGPYLQSIPQNAFTLSNQVVAADAATYGWVYTVTGNLATIVACNSANYVPASATVPQNLADF